MFGYLDESGTPGTANSNNDYLVVSLVLFPDYEACERCSNSINRLRKRLGKSSTYEFHCSRNASKSQASFIKLLHNLQFQFISIAIKKNYSYHNASYARLAGIIIEELNSIIGKLTITMDSNPQLRTTIQKQLKLNRITHIQIKEVKSHSDNLIQLADYVVSISAKKVKKTSKHTNWFKAIEKKQLVFREITG